MLGINFFAEVREDFAEKYGRLNLFGFVIVQRKNQGDDDMPMPTYEDIMLPFLQTLSDGAIHTLKELSTLMIMFCTRRLFRCLIRCLRTRITLLKSGVNA